MSELIFELRFDSLFVTGRGYSFECDALGKVDLNALPDRSRINYLYARAMVGREFAIPHVVASTPNNESCTHEVAV